MKQYKILTIGGATQDIMFYTDAGRTIRQNQEELTAFSYGSKVAAKEILYTFGGGAANTAVSFARLGFETGTLFCLRDDQIGQMIILHLNKEGVDTSLLQYTDKAYSAFSLVVTPGQSKDHIIFLNRGANLFFKLSTKVLSQIKTDWIYLSSLVGAGQASNVKTIFGYLKNKPTKLAWNPGVEQLALGQKYFKDLLPKVTVFIINQEEAEELVLGCAKIGTPIKDLLIKIKAWGPKYVAISCGARGAYVYDGQKIYYHKKLLGTAVNTTGAGDAFGSSLVAGLEHFNGDINKALRLAMLRSGNVVRHVGAQVGLLTDKEVKKYRLW
ncbi:MAG: carbohydrate kinase family protein [Candidatus Komeilibacteria bacterium]|nr:carbohydrate kinase family protein [Candidatus Komeilibacteria bacterium]